MASSTPSLVVLDFNKVFNTVIEMLIDRGYPEEELKEKYYNMDLDLFQELIKDNKINLQVKHPKENKMVIVYFFGVSSLLKMKGEVGKMKKDDINLLISDVKNTMEPDYEYNIIMILKEKPHNIILNKIQDIHSSVNIDEKEKRMFLEYFIQDELKYNCSRHFLVPKHSKCSKEELDLVLKKYSVSLSQLPKMIHDDPQAKYLGLRPGDVCKIERISPTTGKYVYYRLVV
jgi:DNA-directed RNA polymerase subunit H (RpoH/RPB5)